MSLRQVFVFFFLFSSCGIQIDQQLSAVKKSEVKKIADLVLVDFQHADLIIGQEDYSSNSVAAVGSNNFQLPFGSVTRFKDQFYFPDSGRHRVLGFSSFPKQFGSPADLVLGQDDLSSASSGTSATKLFIPSSILATEDKFFVSDSGNDRILIFSQLPLNSESSAAVVVGKSNMDLGSEPNVCTGSSISTTEGFTVAGNKLIVSDSERHRVLIWNQIPTSNGQPADLVLGQPNFTTCELSSSPSSQSLNWPGGVWSDGKKLIVADAENNRILIWNDFPTVNQAAADIVIGQNSMTSTAGSAAISFSLPLAIASNGKQFYVADFRNHRVLVWNDIPKDSETGPNVVLGQSNLVNVAPNDLNQDSIDDGVASAKTFHRPSGLYLDSERLIVTDNRNHRFMVFSNAETAAPYITQDPESLSIYESNRATFEVIATGRSPTYQWYKNDAEIPGETDKRLSFDAQLSDSGSYSVKVTSSGKSVQSKSAQLLVNPGKLISHWKMDGLDTNDSGDGENDGSLVGGGTVVDGAVGDAIQLNAASYFEVPHSTNLNIMGAFSVAVWTKFDSLPVQDSYPGLLAKFNHFAGYGLGWFNGVVGQIGAGNGVWKMTSAFTPTLNKWHHFVATFDDLKLRLYVDGALFSEIDSPPPITSVGQSLKMGSHYNSTQFGTIAGALDDARVYNRPLSATEILELFQLGSP